MNLDDLITRCAHSPDERWDICAELYTALDTGGSERIDLAPYASSFAEFWRDVDEQLRPFQRSHGHSWRWDEDYQDPRNEAGLLLDILGYVPGEPVVRELRSALTLSDTRLVMYAAVSLLWLGQVVSPDTILRIAACDETRNPFLTSLTDIGFGYLFPPEFSDGESVARSALVNWLTHPTEWERAPDQIELMDVVDTDVFVYRFRTEGPWLAGVSGRVTFSDYVPADSALADEHARRMLEGQSRV